MAITAKAPPGTRPARCGKFAPSTAGSRPAITASATLAKAGPASSAVGGAFDDLHADAEDLFLGEAARGIERRFIGLRPRRAGAASIASSRARDGSSPRKSRIQQRIEHGGRAAEMVGQARRGAGDPRDQLRADADWPGTSRTAARPPAGARRSGRTGRRRHRDRRCAASASSSAGISLVRSSRARALRVARMRP